MLSIAVTLRKLQSEVILKFFFLRILKETFNPLMHNVPKWSDTP